MNHLVIECSKCKGEGTVEVPEIFLDTLAILRQLKRACASDVHAKSKDKEFIVASAINRRLELLRANGLVAREREGKIWKYFIPAIHIRRAR